MLFFLNNLHLKINVNIGSVDIFHSRELKVVDSAHRDGEYSSDQIHSSALIQLHTLKWNDDTVQSKISTALDIEVDRLRFDFHITKEGFWNWFKEI